MTTAPASDAELRLDEKDSKLASSRPSLLLFALVILLYVAVRFRWLTSSCLWFDEIFGVHAARHNWTEMLKFVAADIIHPPLFYVLLKLWIGIGGESLFWLRLLPVLFSVAAIVPLVLLARELRLGAYETKLALALLAVNGYLIKYAQEVRMYSLLFLLTCVSLWLFVKFIHLRANSTRMLLALAATTFLLVYTHYYGWLVVIVQLLTLLFWWRQKAAKFLLTILALILAYLPWLYLITISKEPGRGLAQNIGWVARPGLSDVAQFFSMLNTPFFFRQSSVSSLYDVWSICLSLVIFGLPLAALFRQSLRDRNAEPATVRVYWWLTSLAFLPLGFALLLSWVLPHSIWGTRHLIVAAAPYAILAALALFRLQPQWARAACLVLLSCWCLLNGAVFLLKQPPNFIWCTWEPLAQQMLRSEVDGTGEVQIYAFEDLVAYHLWFALDTARRQGVADRFKLHVAKGIPGLLEDPAYFLPRRFHEVESQDGAAIKGESVWIAFRDSAWSPRRPPLSLVEAQGYETGRVFELPAQGQRAFIVELVRKGQTR